jgi:NADH:ubiquinone oxidoreductase subunit 3 (subunit A)
MKSPFALVVISDVETVFLYPWAMCFNELGPNLVN